LSNFKVVALIPIEKDDETHKPRGGEFILKTNQNKTVFEKLLHPRIISKIFCLKPISNQ